MFDHFKQWYSALHNESKGAFWLGAIVYPASTIFLYVIGDAFLVLLWLLTGIIGAHYLLCNELKRLETVSEKFSKRRRAQRRFGNSRMENINGHAKKANILESLLEALRLQEIHQKEYEPSRFMLAILRTYLITFVVYSTFFAFTSTPAYTGLVGFSLSGLVVSGLLIMLIFSRFWEASPISLLSLLIISSGFSAIVADPIYFTVNQFFETPVQVILRALIYTTALFIGGGLPLFAFGKGIIQRRTESGRINRKVFDFIYKILHAIDKRLTLTEILGRNKIAPARKVKPIPSLARLITVCLIIILSVSSWWYWADPPYSKNKISTTIKNVEKAIKQPTQKELFTGRPDRDDMKTWSTLYNEVVSGFVLDRRALLPDHCKPYSQSILSGPFVKGFIEGTKEVKPNIGNLWLIDAKDFDSLFRNVIKNGIAASYYSKDSTAIQVVLAAPDSSAFYNPYLKLFKDSAFSWFGQYDALTLDSLFKAGIFKIPAQFYIPSVTHPGEVDTLIVASIIMWPPSSYEPIRLYYSELPEDLLISTRNWKEIQTRYYKFYQEFAFYEESRLGELLASNKSDNRRPGAGELLGRAIDEKRRFGVSTVFRDVSEMENKDSRSHEDIEKEMSKKGGAK